jgi:type III secretion protein L
MQNYISSAPLVVELRSDRPTLAPGVQRLRSADFERLMDTYQTLSEAEIRAEDIVRRAKKVQDDARQQGLREGRFVARGELLSAVSEMQATLQEWVRATEPQLVAMVLRCVREVVKSVDADSLVRGSIGRSLSEMTTASEIRIKVHESHLADLRAEVNTLAEDYAIEGSIRIESTPSLKPGDCIVESPLGTIDLRIESQLKFVDQTLTPG